MSAGGIEIGHLPAGHDLLRSGLFQSVDDGVEEVFGLLAAAAVFARTYGPAQAVMA
ncbi:hypothetical protein ACIF6K_28770 [Streptomyces sp. NPDC085942]|uniref:hypothetical protein n=1 Tax=Streptomyces sp. NPDC085942 TaxID=3365743 RepID=UPI0037D54FEA